MKSTSINKFRRILFCDLNQKLNFRSIYMVYAKIP